jgi:glyoxylase-like metal-dependent hydrolase (beta-lactamase superfamily II)
VGAFWPSPALPPRLIPVVDHQVIALDDDHDDDDGVADDGDGDFFVARHLPGHTASSTVWLWHDIAFTGDALFGDEDGGVSMAPALLSDNDDAARAAVSVLWGATVTVLLDGHGGRTDDAAGHIAGYLNRGRGPHCLRRSP